MKRKWTAKKLLTSAVFTIIPLILFLLFILFPIYWTVVTSFKPESEITSKVISYLPKTFTFKNFYEAWNNVGFSIYFKNSLYIAVGGVLLIVLVSIMVGYALSRFKFKGKTTFMLVLLCTQFIPSAMLITPMFIIFKKIGLLNNLFALVLVNTTFQIPFNAILMRGFVSGIDYTIEEAAQIDGCSRVGAIVRVVIPLLKPGIVATGAFAFIHCWNEFLFSFMFISKQSKFPLSVGLKYMMGEYAINYGQLAAGAVIAVVPVLIIFSYIQKYLVGGISAGAVKG